MSQNTNNKTKPDRWVYASNLAKFSPDDLLPYAGEWLAWSADGSRIVAHHKDLIEAARLVAECGWEREDVIFDHLPPPGEDFANLL